jgi:hypothetical protein
MCGSKGNFTIIFSDIIFGLYTIKWPQNILKTSVILLTGFQRYLIQYNNTGHRACHLNIVLLKISIKIIYLIFEMKILNYTRHNNNNNNDNSEYESKRLLMK